MDFQDARGSDRDTPEGNLTGGSALTAAAQGQGLVLLPNADNVVVLPEGATLDDLSVRGRDILVTLPDGRVFVIPDGAVYVPQIVVDDVAVPPLNLAALLTGNEPQPAAGPVQSSGGNFADPTGPIQDAYGLGDLLPYTELSFAAQQDEEVLPQLVDDEPDVVVETPDNPAGAINAIATVDEEGLPARGDEPAGTAAESDAETTTGTIVFNSPDGTSAVLINDVAVTTVGQAFVSPFGTMTITSIDLAGGRIGFSYTLADNLVGETADGFFTMTVVDADGDMASASLQINVIDDGPIGFADTNAVAAGTFGPVQGNVIDNDVPGADGFSGGGDSAVTGFASATETGGPGSTISGTYGEFTLNADGTYSYTRSFDTPGGVEDRFTYSIVDGDGTTATDIELTIAIGDSPPAIVSVPEIGDGTEVNENQLPSTTDTRSDEAPGSQFVSGPETTTGTITFHSKDGVSSVSLGGTIITPGSLPQTVASDDTGTLTVIDYTYDPATGDGSVTYVYTLNDNTANTDGTTVSFDVTVIDADGDEASETLDIHIIDDVPAAADETAVSLAEDAAAIGGNVLVNDTRGADGASVTSVSIDGTDYAVAASGTTNVSTDNGDYTFDAEGNWTFDPNPGLDQTGGAIDASFTYTLTDGDGDTDTATQPIAITDGAGPVAGDPVSLTVDDENLSDGSSPSVLVTASDSIAFTAGSDAIDTIAFGTDLSGLEASLTWVRVDDTTITGSDGATLIVTLSLTRSGDTATVTAILSNNYDAHPAIDLDDTKALGSVDVIATDIDGDSATSSVSVSVSDDLPEAFGESAAQVSENTAFTIDALGNDTFGADGVDTSDATKVFVSSQASQGTVTYDASTGLFTYSPNPGAGSTSTADSFEYTIVDGDGDISTAVVNVSLQPDSEPQGSERVATVDDDGLAGGNPASTIGDIDANDDDAPADTSEASFTGVVAFDVGNDTPATVTFDASLGGATAAIGLETVTYAISGSTLTATITGGARDGTALFQVEILDSQTGEYKVTLLTNVLNAGGPNDEAQNAFASIDFTVTDSDGDTTSTNLAIVFNDDAPTAYDDGNAVGEGETISGNVLSDATADVFGADGQGGIVSFTDGVDTAGAGEPIETALGFLTIYPDGSYEYQSKPNSTDTDTADSFTYAIVDADGDTSTATLTIDITAVTGSVSDNDVSVDESGLDNGTYTGSQLVPDGEFDTDGQISASGGTPPYSYVLTSPSDGTYGTLTLNGVTGEYSYTLDTPFTDAVSENTRNTVNDAESFGYEVYDDNGNLIGSGSISVNIVDDVPAISALAPSADALTVDESDLDTDATADFSGLFTPDYNADIPGTIGGYTLGINAGATGLVDTLTGEDVVLVLNGGVVEGRTDTSNALVFSVSVDGGGTVTLNQERAVAHADDTDANDAAHLASSDLITLTATATDNDGDTADATVNIGGAFTFLDDGPSIDAAVTDGDTVVLVTKDADTIGASTSSAVSTADFGGAFTVASSNHGADGAGSVVWNYSLEIENSVSNLGHEGETINLYLIGGKVVGSIAGDAGSVNDGNTVFDIAVSSTTGVVTLTQYQEIDHALPGDTAAPYDDQLATLAGNLVNLVGKATITDGDDDEASETVSLDLGGNIRFADDGPSVSGAALNSSVTVDETDAGSPAGFPISNTSANPMLTFTSDDGADDGGATTYSIAVVGGGSTGLRTAQGDLAITLVQTSDTTITGVYDADDKTAFTVTINADGTVTLVQEVPLEHLTDGPVDPDDYNDALDLAGLIEARVTVTDDDGDSASGSAQIGGAIIFRDDGPNAADDTDAVTEDGPLKASGNVITGAGSDGNAGGADSYGGDREGAVTAVMGTAAGVIGADTPGSYGTLMLGADGEYTYTLDNTSAAVQSLTSGTTLTDTFTYTITDADGDTATATLTVNIFGTNDAPVVTGSAVAVSEEGLNFGNPDDDPVSPDEADTTNSTSASGSITISDVDSGDTHTVTLGTPAQTLYTPDGVTPLTWVVSQDGHTLTGYSTNLNSPEIVVTIDDNGDYDVTLGGPVHHADTTSEDLTSFIVPVTVGDGTTTTTLTNGITVTIEDDSPIAVPDSGQMLEGGSSSGNVLQDSHVGGDSTPAWPSGMITGIASVNRSTSDTTPDGSGDFVLAGEFGTLTMNRNGTYTYQSTADGLTDSDQDVFEFTMVDADGDPSTSTLTIDVLDVTLVADNQTKQVDEAALDAVTDTGDLGHGTVTGSNPGSTAETVTGTLNVTGPTGTVTYVPQSETTAHGIFELNSDGTYTYTLTTPFTTSPDADDGAVVEPGVEMFTYTAQDVLGNSVTGTITINVKDDVPTATVPDAVSLTNAAGGSSSAYLDADLTVADNYGADGAGAVIFTAASITSLESQNLTSGLVSLEYSISADGTVLTASKSSDSSLVFTIELQPSGSADQYVVTMAQKVDSLTTVDFNNAGYNFVGGNTSWAGFTLPGDNDSQDLLLTPIGDGSVNTNANEGGIGNNSVGSSEAMRVDYVIDLVGSPVSGGDFADPADQTQSFDGHYTVNGGSAYFTNITSSSTVTIAAFDDDDSGTLKNVGDGSPDTITSIAISYNSVQQFVSVAGTYSIGGNDFTVTFNGDGTANVSGVVGNTQIAAYTDDGYNSIEWGHGGGNTFKIGDFGATTITNDPVNFTVPVSIQDGDGDTVSSGNLNITLNPVVDPIALDLDGDGVEYLGLNAGVAYDYGTGLVQTAWVAPDDGLLAHATGGALDIVFTDDAPGAETDLEGLRLAYDGNGDGKFTAADGAFHEFGVWRDANSNGLVDEGEFQSLLKMGITSIDLTSDGAGSMEAGGDVIVHGTGQYTIKGATYALADVSLATGDRIAARNAEIATVGLAVAGFMAAQSAYAQPLPPVATEIVSAALRTFEPDAPQIRVVLPESGEGAPLVTPLDGQAPQHPQAEPSSHPSADAEDAHHGLTEVVQHQDFAPEPLAGADDGQVDFGASMLSFAGIDSGLMQALLLAAQFGQTGGDHEEAGDLPAVKEAIAQGDGQSVVDALIDHFAAHDGSAGVDITASAAPYHALDAMLAGGELHAAGMDAGFDLAAMAAAAEAHSMASA